MSNINVSGVPCAPMTGRGKVFYVDLDNATSVASDNNTGTNASKPKSTITSALSSCVSGRGDVIVVSGKSEITSAISVTVDNVSIIGINPDSPLGGEARLEGENIDLISVSADKVRIENLRLVLTGDAADRYSAIKVAAESYHLVVRNCAINLNSNTNDVGIEITAALWYSLIDNVKITSPVGKNHAAGIKADAAIGTTGCIIRDTYIMGLMTEGIVLPVSAQDVVQRVTILGATASIGVTGATSAVTDCRVDVAVSGTALAGSNTTIA